MENFDIESFLALGIGLIIFAFIFLIAVYVVLGIVLNKLNKKIYGKGTALAWIPLCDIYLLGKLTVSKFFGVILLILSLLNSSITLGDGENKMIYTLIPEEYKWIYYLVYGILFIALFIVAIVKLNKLGKNEEAFINEVYLNQKTKQEIMEEDEQVNLVKWDDNEQNQDETKEIVQEESNIPFQNISNLNSDTNPVLLEEKAEQYVQESNNIKEEVPATDSINDILNEEPQEEIDNTQNVLVLTTNKPEETIDVEEDNTNLEASEEVNMTQNDNIKNNEDEIVPEEIVEKKEMEEENNQTVISEEKVEQPALEVSVVEESNIIENHDDVETEYDHDNPKIQEAIDNIVHKEKTDENDDNE